MGAKELFRFLEVEAHRPRKPRPVDSFLPRPEEWPTQLDAEEEKVYKVSDEDVAGLNLEGSVSLQEILDKEIPGGAPPPAARDGEDGDEEDAVTAEDMEEMNLGGSVSLDELLGEDAPTRPSPPPAPPRVARSVPPLDVNEELFQTQTGVSKKDLSLDELLDELVPDEPKPKKRK